MRKKYLFDVFRGFKDKKGRVKKIRNVGHVHYDKEMDLLEVDIAVLEGSSFILEPETDVYKKYDYLIYLEDLSKKDFQTVGFGYLLHGPNLGLVQLKWEFYYTKHIYADLFTYQSKVINFNEKRRSCQLKRRTV